MRATLLGTLAVLAAAQLVLPTRGAAVASTTVRAPAALSFEKHPSLVRRTPLVIDELVCEGIACEAHATGGSGSGYSFTWINMTELYDASGYSAAQVECPFYGQKLVKVTVTDSNGSTASRQWYMRCPNVSNP